MDELLCCLGSSACAGSSFLFLELLVKSTTVVVSISGLLLLPVSLELLELEEETDSVTVVEPVVAGAVGCAGVDTVEDENVDVVVVDELLLTGTDSSEALVVLEVVVETGAADPEVTLVDDVIDVVEVTEEAGVAELAAAPDPLVAMSVGVPNSLVSSTKAAMG